MKIITIVLIGFLILSIFTISFLYYKTKIPTLKTSGGYGHSTVQDLYDYEIELARYEKRKPHVVCIDEKINDGGEDIPLCK